MNKWQWRGIVSVLFALSLVLGLSAGTAMAQVEICNDGIDNDGDKAIDCKDSDCTNSEFCKTPPPPDGTPCSPGYWKNHLDEFNEFCTSAAALTVEPRLDSCSDLLTALTCKGSDASCLRSAAAALLNTVSGCEE